MPYLWERYRDDPEAFKQDDDFENERDFISAMMQENLNHARHVEGERQNLCSFITSLVAGIIALANGLKDVSFEFQLALYLFAIAAVLFASSLNERWGNVFGQHLEYAKGCYYIIHRSYFHSPQSAAAFNGDSAAFFLHAPAKNTAKPADLDTYPLYCFNIAKKKPEIRTRTIFSLLYGCLLGALIFALFYILPIGYGRGLGEELRRIVVPLLAAMIAVLLHSGVRLLSWLKCRLSDRAAKVLYWGLLALLGAGLVVTMLFHW